jgi:hypothetical protein
MVRFSSFLMTLLLTVPMLRDCCLLVAHTQHCHESNYADDLTCSSNQQALTETKIALDGNSPIQFQTEISDDLNPAILSHIKCGVDRNAYIGTPTTDIYLRTGTLLI